MTALVEVRGLEKRFALPTLADRNASLGLVALVLCTAVLSLGSFLVLRRMTRPTFVVYSVVQLAAGHISANYALPGLAGRSPFHTFTRGWCHWLGYEAARLLGYDLERRQLRKWPELGAQGEFERWERMSRVNRPSKMLNYFNAHLSVLAKKHLSPPAREDPAVP